MPLSYTKEWNGIRAQAAVNHFSPLYAQDLRLSVFLHYRVKSHMPLHIPRWHNSLKQHPRSPTIITLYLSSLITPDSNSKFMPHHSSFRHTSFSSSSSSVQSLPEPESSFPSLACRGSRTLQLPPGYATQLLYTRSGLHLFPLYCSSFESLFLILVSATVKGIQSLLIQLKYPPFLPTLQGILNSSR